MGPIFEGVKIKSFAGASPEIRKGEGPQYVVSVLPENISEDQKKVSTSFDVQLTSKIKRKPKKMFR